MRKINDFLQYTSGVAIVDYEEGKKPTSFWVIFNKETREKINKFIMEEVNKQETHMVKNCQCGECAKQRRKEVNGLGQV